MIPFDRHRKLIEHILIPLAIFCLALGLRLALIGKGYYHSDNLFLGIQAQKMLATGTLHYLHLVGYPLTGLLGALFLKVGQLAGMENPALSINGMSVIFGSLAVMVFYFAVKRMTDLLTAILSAGLVMVHPVTLAASVYGNSHAPSLFFLFCGLALLLRYRDDRRRVTLSLAAVSAGLMAAARPQNMIMLLPLSYVLFLESPRASSDIGLKPKAGRCLVFLLLTVGTCLFFFIPLLHPDQAAASSGWTLSSLWSQVAPNIDLAPFPFISKSILLSFTPLGMVLIVLGFIFLFRQNLRLLSLILFLALPQWLFYGCFLTYVPRYTQATVMALSILAAAYLTDLIKKKSFPSLVGILAYGLLIVALFAGIHDTLLFRHRHDLMRHYGLWFQAKTPPHAVIYCQDDGTIIRHYAQRRTANMPLVKFAHRYYHSQDNNRIASEVASIHKMLANGIPVFVTRSALTSYDPRRLFLKALREEFRLQTIDDCLMEDWHQGVLRTRLFRERLYRIVPLSK